MFNIFTVKQVFESKKVFRVSTFVFHEERLQLHSNYRLRIYIVSGQREVHGLGGSEFWFDNNNLLILSESWILC